MKTTYCSDRVEPVVSFAATPLNTESMRQHRERWLNRIQEAESKFNIIENCVHEILNDIEEDKITTLKSVYDRLLIAVKKSNLTPTPEARVAMIIYSDEYEKQCGGSMDFFDSLDEDRKHRCKLVVATLNNLSATDKKVLLTALRSKGFTKNKVYADSLEKKREFNSAIKLTSLGLINGEVTYEHTNGYAVTGFGRTWVDGKSWNSFKGELTKKGIEVAKVLLPHIRPV